MEEVDPTTSHSQRQLDVDICGNDVKKISDQPVEVVDVESATKCISDIDTTRKVPMKLPSGVSQRIEVAAQTASICKDLGYQNDVGYQTYLYHNGTVFLIQRLPSEDKTQSAEVQSANKNHTLFKDICSKISKGFNTIRVLLWRSTQSTAGDFAHNKEDLRFSWPPEVKTDPLTISLRQKLYTLKSERNPKGVKLSEAQEDYKRSVAHLKNVLCIADEIEKSDQIVSKMIEDITSTNSYLKVRIDELKSINSLSETDGTNCRNTSENLKESAKAIKEECEKKEEIIGNVNKIDPAMEKVIKVATKLQKQINAVQVQLGICLFRVQDRNIADEAKRAYKSLGLLQSECNRMATFASASSTLYRDTIDLRDSLEAEMSKLPEETLKKIQSDLANVQEEH